MKNKILRLASFFFFLGTCGCAGTGNLNMSGNEAEKAATVSREVKFTNTHIMDAGRSGSYANLGQAMKGGNIKINPRLKNVKRVAIVAFAGNIKSKTKTTSGGDGVSFGAGSAVSTQLVADKDFKKGVLINMYVSFARQISKQTGWVIIHPKNISANSYYAGLDYGDVPTKKLFGIFGPSYKAAWQGVSTPGLKYLMPPVFEWGPFTGPAENQTFLGGIKQMGKMLTFKTDAMFKNRDFDEFAIIMGKLTRELNVDAVFTVQNEVVFVPAFSGWGVELDGIAANLWGADGNVLWSGKVEKNAEGEWTVDAGSALEEVWQGIEKPYNFVCELMALKLRKDI
ncbi:MAG: hypothetical protein HY796_13640 [Elusimicrobia bacterium]|nr:hypothetical protein [Elusimicrobiota bacterium]